jgi:hypothetical protein
MYLSCRQAFSESPLRTFAKVEAGDINRASLLEILAKKYSVVTSLVAKRRKLWLTSGNTPAISQPKNHFDQR